MSAVVVASVARYVPAAHVVEAGDGQPDEAAVVEVMPVVSAVAKKPAAQSVQAIAPSAEKDPAAQAVQPSCTVATVPVASIVPAGHPWRG